MSTSFQRAPMLSASTGATVVDVPFRRLLKVELQKLIDTRASRRLLAAVGIITAAALTAFLLIADARELTFLRFVQMAGTPQAFLLPVLAIHSVTSEWNHTDPVTYTPEPQRARIVFTKFAAVMVMALVAALTVFGVAALGNAAGIALRDGSGSWELAAGNVRDLVILQLSGFVIAFAFGLLLMNTRMAVVLYYAVQLVTTSIFSLVAGLQDVAPWLDINTALLPVTEGEMLHGNDWSHLAVSGTIWALIPLALGVLRVLFFAPSDSRVGLPTQGVTGGAATSRGSERAVRPARSALPVPSGALVARASLASLGAGLALTVAGALLGYAVGGKDWLVLGVPAGVIGSSLGLWAVLVRRCGWGWREIGFVRPRRSLWHLAWQIPGSIVVGGIGAALLGSAFGLPSDGPTSALEDTALGPWVFVLMAVCAVLIAPAAEEILFRRLLLDWLASRIGIRAALALSAMAFAAVHLAPAVMVYIVFLGFFAGLFRRWYDSLWPPMALHAANNALITVVVAVVVWA